MVYHLPFKPEMKTDDDRRVSIHVAKLFSATSVGVSVTVPYVSKDIYEESKDKKNDLFGPVKSYEPSDKFKRYEVDKKGLCSSDSMYAMDLKRLETMETDLVNAKKFLELKTIQQVGDDIQFKNIKTTNILDANCETKKYKLALHSSRMANLLASRTDDPKTGVGVVLLKAHDLEPNNLDLFEYVGVGWNGYPMGAQFEDYPKDGAGASPSQQKYEFIIHAEYNAALFRNTSKLAGCYSYATRRPCDDCFPLWEKFRIKEAYYPWKKLDYETIPRKLSIDCYETPENHCAETSTGPPDGQHKDADAGE